MSFTKAEIKILEKQLSLNAEILEFNIRIEEDKAQLYVYTQYDKAYDWDIREWNDPFGTGDRYLHKKMTFKKEETDNTIVFSVWFYCHNSKKVVAKDSRIAEHTKLSILAEQYVPHIGKDTLEDICKAWLKENAS